MKKNKNGFTLAEVLITLVIIGIIAAMTIPTLMNKTNEQETVVAVKKAYSVLSQAYQRMIAENGEIYPENLGATREEATKTFGEMFIKYLNVQKNCGMATDGDCWSTDNEGKYKFFNGDDWAIPNNSSTDYKFRLSDGISVSFAVDAYISNTLTNYDKYGEIAIDANGDKGPNTLGKDVFKFHITKYGIYPVGSPNEQSSSSTNFSTCRTTGRGCAGWVITKGNMDYLRKEVSW